MDRGRQWALAERDHVDEVLQTRRQRSGFVDAGFRVQDLDSHVGGGILAGAIAFRMFLFLVPFVYVVFTVFGLAARAAHEDPSHLAKTVGVTGLLASAVVNTQERSVWTQLVVVVGAIFALLITARSFTKCLYIVHWLVWHEPRVKPTGVRPMFVVIGLALVMTVLGIALNDVRAAWGIAGAAAVILVITAMSFAVWWWVSWRLPHPATPATALIPGAVFMAVGVDVLHLLTTYYIGHLVARKTETYGAVGIALAVLFWVYVLGRFIVGSAGLNATLWYRRLEQESAPDAVADAGPAPG